MKKLIITSLVVSLFVPLVSFGMTPLEEHRWEVVKTTHLRWENAKQQALDEQTATPSTSSAPSAPASTGSTGSSGGTSPYFYGQAWDGLTLSQLTVHPCEYFDGCVDISNTRYYKNMMHDTAIELQSKGVLHQFPLMTKYL